MDSGVFLDPEIWEVSSNQLFGEMLHNMLDHIFWVCIFQKIKELRAYSQLFLLARNMARNISLEKII